ncbi:MAG: hypothetical protein JST04_11625 [Bdellovibrionales bacterium]|nr:hypothetical protein [Bdellovibrionales bacterium]
MKLKLEALRDISILVAEGPITPENFAVLRAGIKKLFKDGKNKIILELPDSGTIAPPLLRELATLNLLASELAGSIVLAQIAPLTRAKIEAFSKPPAVRCFADRAKAAEFFYPPNEEAGKSPGAASTAPAAPSPQPLPAPNVGAPTPQKSVSFEIPGVASAATVSESASGGEDKAKQFKAEIRAKEMGDLGSVRKKLSDLEAENAELKTRIAEMIVSRRDPPDLDAWKEKVSLLEKQLADAIKTAQDAAAAKK